jgi:hypothetical protein
MMEAASFSETLVSYCNRYCMASQPRRHQCEWSNFIGCMGVSYAAWEFYVDNM